MIRSETSRVQTSLKSYVEVLKVLSEEIRIRLLRLLDQQELMVGEIQEIVEVKQSNLSSHLNILRKYGLVNRRREGQKIFYKSSNSSDHSIQEVLKKILETTKDISLFNQDILKMKQVIENRKETSLLFFNESENNQITPGQVPEAILLGFIQVIPPTTIIDMGCGKGNLCRLLAEAGHEVYGIDHSPKQIEEAGCKNHIKNLTGRIHFHVEDMEKTTFHDGFFTLACLCHSLHHTANPQKAIAEAYRILAPGGNLLIFDLDHHKDHKMESKFGDFWMGFPNRELIDWLQKIGFEIRLNKILSETLYPVKKKIIQAVKPLIIIAQRPT